MMCRTKILHNIKQDNLTLESFYLDTIHDKEDSTFWMTDVKVNNISVTFKVDTGAEVTAVSESILKTLGQLEVSMLDKKLCGSARLEGKKQHKCYQEIFMNLLGLPAIKGFHLLSVLDNLECDPTTAIRQLINFTGLGTLQGDYEIQVKQDAQPFSLGTARNIPLPLRDKVKLQWKLKELYQRYNSLLHGALAWWL